MGVCGLYLGRREIGRLHWDAESGRLRLRASCPCEPGWIYRVVLYTDKGEHRLGVMLPEAENFTLCRDIPAGEVPTRALIDRTQPGEAHLPGLPLAFSAFSPWAECDGAPGPEVSCADWMDVRYLLFPLERDRPCPLAPYLCLTTVVVHEGKEYGVFCQRGGDYLPVSDNLRNASVLR